MAEANWPEAQAAQFNAPEIDNVKLPAAHEVQIEAAAVEEYKPAKQDTQVLDSAAPVELEAVPAAQEMQIEAAEEG